jgi:hypothetical protein
MDSSPQRQRISFYVSAENIEETLVEINAEVKGAALSICRLRNFCTG